MASRPRALPSPLPLFLLMAAVGLGTSACHGVRPDLGPERTLEAGVPESFGSQSPKAPTVTWDFGDGTPPQTAAGARHAWATAGRYTVRALDGQKELARVVLTVVPRPVLRAVPADAQTVLWVPRLRGNVEGLMGFYERMVGAANARRTLEDAPLVPLLLRGVSGGRSEVDPEEGFGFFLLPDFDGVVALLGVTDPKAAIAAVSRELRSAGHQVLPREDGSARVDPVDGGRSMLLFADRGYVYLAVPDSPDAPAPGETVKALAAVEESADVERVRRHVEALSGPGMAENVLLAELRAKVRDGSVFLFSSPPVPEAEKEDMPVRGFFGALAVQADQAELDGFLSSSRPLLGETRGPASALLGRAAVGPVAAAQLSVPPEELARLVFGSPRSPRRERTLERWRKQGLDAEPLLKALRGDVAMLVYFDAAAFFQSFVRNPRPAPKGTVVMEAGLTGLEPVLKLVQKQLEDNALVFQKEAQGNTTRFRTRLLEQPVSLTLTPERATLEAGEVLSGRESGDVGRTLRTRFGGDAFGPGHLSLMVDMGQLKADLASARSVPGVGAAQLMASQVFVTALLERLTPFEYGFLDFSPTEGGGRLQGRVVLRER
ncbi:MULTISPECIES: PKD domain-containing protein [Corallococcus]|uniref:PKD domain-containing protein n=1 Tax=Corallococcus TaxID=83461 RepID=UPI00117E615C|nr:MULTISPECIES: PKD domain-containing protein [Corallococcus]NBD08538.1 PKD domain-containing protein [Corallococcus silvisoli]TSC33139.1 PKD domain-containing protein [Corallococcus sp. Z5C101001]